MAKPDDAQFNVTQSYADLLAAEAKAAGLRQKDLIAASEYERTSIWGLFTGERPSLAVATAVKRAIEEAAPSADIPPPAVAILDRDDYAWIRLGRMIREGSPETWREIYDLVISAGNAAEQILKTRQGVKGLIDRKKPGGRSDPSGIP